MSSSSGRFQEICTPVFIQLSSPPQPLEPTILQECGLYSPLTLSVSNIASPLFRHQLNAQILPLIVAILYIFLISQFLSKSQQQHYNAKVPKEKKKRFFQENM